MIYLKFARERVKKYFLISNVSVWKISVSWAAFCPWATGWAALIYSDITTVQSSAEKPTVTQQLTKLHECCGTLIPHSQDDHWTLSEVKALCNIPHHPFFLVCVCVCVCVCACVCVCVFFFFIYIYIYTLYWYSACSIINNTTCSSFTIIHCYRHSGSNPEMSSWTQIPLAVNDLTGNAHSRGCEGCKTL